MTEMITRFAPSPTGYLHLGHAASAHHVWTYASQHGGQVLLRIEDIDQTRCRADYTQSIYEDLGWLGFSWPTPVRIQSEHMDAYAVIIQHLADKGFAYRCFRTRAEIRDLMAQSDTPGMAYVGHPLPAVQERDCLARGEAYAWRLNLQEIRSYLGAMWDDLAFAVDNRDGQIAAIKADPFLHGDIVVARKDAPVAYHLAACFDDNVQCITHIIRGTDLADAPHIQCLIQVLMGWSQPVYVHHELILDETGKRLSKTAKSASLREFRRFGHRPMDIWQRLALI